MSPPSTPSDASPARDFAATSVALGGFYFFSFGALGAFFPFLPLLLAARGLGPQQIGWVMVLIPIGNLAVPPLWGLLADSLQARLALLRIAAVGAACTIFLFGPEWKIAGSMLAVGALSLFRAPLTSLADATAAHELARTGGDFGRVRVWGSLGFGLFVLVVGLANASRHPWLLVAATAFAYLSAAASTLPLRKRPSAPSPSVLTHVGAILVEPPILALLAANAFHYVAHGAYDAFFSLHLHRIGFSDRFVGAAWMVGIAVEVCVMLLARAVLEHRSGAGVLALCSAVAALRWILLSSLTSAIPILLTQTLHGITFGLWYLALVRTIQQRAPDQLRTSLQAIAFAFVGLGMVVGYLAGGLLLGRFGGPALFQMGSVCAAIASVLYLTSHRSRTRAIAAG